jgi:hypothetical protein
MGIIADGTVPAYDAFKLTSYLPNSRLGDPLNNSPLANAHDLNDPVHNVLDRLFEPTPSPR